MKLFIFMVLIIFMIVEGCFKGTSPGKSEQYYIKCAKYCVDSVDFHQCHKDCIDE